VSIPIGMSPTLKLLFFAYEEIEKYTNFFIRKKEDTPKTSNKTTIDVNEVVRQLQGRKKTCTKSSTVQK
jgi:hypothetical protein